MALAYLRNTASARKSQMKATVWIDACVCLGAGQTEWEPGRGSTALSSREFTWRSLKTAVLKLTASASEATSCVPSLLNVTGLTTRLSSFFLPRVFPSPALLALQSQELT